MNNSKQFIENLVKNAIGFFYGNDFNHLKKFEHPDWISDSIGLEIRQSFDESLGEYNAFINNHLGTELDQKSLKSLVHFGFPSLDLNEKNKRIIELRSDKYGLITLIKLKNKSEFTLVGAVEKPAYMSNDFIYLKKALRDKLSKLNCHYLLRGENDLGLFMPVQTSYLYANGIINDYYFNNLIDAIDCVYSEKKYKIYFNYIFILFLDCLIKIDPTNLCYDQRKIDNELFITLTKESEN